MRDKGRKPSAHRRQLQKRKDIDFRRLAATADSLEERADIVSFFNADRCIIALLFYYYTSDIVLFQAFLRDFLRELVFFIAKMCRMRQ